MTSCAVASSIVTSTCSDLAPRSLLHYPPFSPCRSRLFTRIHGPDRFYKAGYDAGYEHGQAHGIFEGRALGQEKGFEVWEELGYYLGQARFWKEVVSKEDSPKKK